MAYRALLFDLDGTLLNTLDLQRNNQKVIEFAPAVCLDEDTRQAICGAAVKAASAIGYTNAGTIEFLLADNGEFYFMEMNTRLQVEHPVTEMITGVDIVQEQIKIAMGQPLSYQQEDIVLSGFAIECYSDGRASCRERV